MTIELAGRQPDFPDDDRSPSVRLRASDVDRHATVRRLQDGIARGQLAFDEGGERMAAAYACRYLDELGPLTADLPTPAPGPPTAPGWPTLALLARVQLRESLRTTPTRDPRVNRAVAAVALVLATMICLMIGLAVVHGLIEGPPPGGFGGPRFGGPRG